MNNNIGTQVVNPEANLDVAGVIDCEPKESDSSPTPTLSGEEKLEALAKEIEQLSTEASRQIAKRLVAARDHFRYRRDEGGFTGWLETRLGDRVSVATAYRLINAYERFGECFSLWETLPASALYALAAPGTPEAAVKEVVDRVESGAKPSVADVKGTIGLAKGGKNRAPKTSGSSKSKPGSNDVDPEASADSVEARPAIKCADTGEVAQADRLDPGAGEQRDDPADRGDFVDRGAAAETDIVPEYGRKAAPATASNVKSVLSLMTWRAADEAMKAEITQGDDIAVILGRMSEKQKEKLFDRLAALQIKEAKNASKSVDDMLKSISGTFWYMADLSDPEQIAEALRFIKDKLAKRGLTA
jgi:hypothetical protein